MKEKDAKKQQKKAKKPSLIVRITDFIALAIRFVTYDMWRITGNDVSGYKHLGIHAAKSISLAVRSFLNLNLPSRASALTYSILLAFVPFLAVLLGIAKGFGFQEHVRQVLINTFPGQGDNLENVFGFVERYLDQIQGGLIIGIGVVILLYTVINLLSNIENTFNDIWQINKPRSFARKVTDYLALLLIIPVLMVASSGMSIFVQTIQNTILDEFVFLTPVVDLVLKIVPFVIASFVFAGLYIFLPNTKVKFLPGLIAGILAGCAFQIFQLIYISGQIWVGKYNAIYGTFAAIPLLLLWVQLSWVICLFGGALAYAIQNASTFNYDADTQHISRRYRDFVLITIMTLIVKRFEKGEKPYTADELSQEYHIPIRLATDILYQLSELNLVAEVLEDHDEWTIYYQPAIDINLLSVSYVLQQVDREGSENFRIDRENLFRAEWEAVIHSREEMYNKENHLLLKDIGIEK